MKLIAYIALVAGANAIQRFSIADMTVAGTYLGGDRRQYNISNENDPAPRS